MRCGTLIFDSMARFAATLLRGYARCVSHRRLDGRIIGSQVLIVRISDLPPLRRVLASHLVQIYPSVTGLVATVQEELIPPRFCHQPSRVTTGIVLVIIDCRKRCASIAIAVATAIAASTVVAVAATPAVAAAAASSPLRLPRSSSSGGAP